MCHWVNFSLVIYCWTCILHSKLVSLSNENPFQETNVSFASRYQRRLRLGLGWEHVSTSPFSSQNSLGAESYYRPRTFTIVSVCSYVNWLCWYRRTVFFDDIIIDQGFPKSSSEKLPPATYSNKYRDQQSDTMQRVRDTGHAVVSSSDSCLPGSENSEEEEAKKD